MSVEVVYTDKALKDLKKLEIKFARQIVKKVGVYSKEGFSKHSKKLKSPFDDLYRFRIGDYRVIFDIDSKGNLTILTVLTIKHRKDLY